MLRMYANYIVVWPYKAYIWELNKIGNTFYRKNIILSENSIEKKPCTLNQHKLKVTTIIYIRLFTKLATFLQGGMLLFAMT